ncbi:MAG: carotenoid biosynthesis protein [Ignavibacterium sp.]|jgi:putative membrane protein|uniref:carotenoid biosynthesis protein n=1 Tax=Ignavibacterium album TaxID=591197 RepID=UPI0026F325E3|nr:carotenoid biosynthesis protein [Ignavibacterium album]MCA2004179.1 carotenoid biosynthesis protein [Ignavibacterium sp.]MCX8105089.1 carotenoid biosynthesis protein [Ignavibacterium album]
MERKKNLKLSKEEICIYLIYFVGIAGHLISPLLAYMKLLTPIALFITGGIVLFSTLKNSNTYLLVWLIITYITTFILEVIGVKTGLIFGSYSYGNTLGLKIFDVPLIIGFNWTMIILGVILLSEKFFTNKILITLSASLIATIFDYFMEPSAIKLEYWNWTDIMIPLQNYLAWFLISFVFAALYLRLRIKIETDLPIKFFLTQFIFFLILFGFMR